MRKISSYIIYISVGTLVISMFFAVSHLHKISRAFELFALFLLISGLFMRLFIPAARGIPYDVNFQRRYRWANRLVYIGLILLFIGLLCKKMHYAGCELVMQLGLLVLAGGGIFLWAVLRTKNDYFLSSALDALLSNQDLEKYTGIYACAELRTEMEVTVVDNHLYGRMKGQGAFRVSAVKEHIFNNIALKAVLEFYPGRNELALIQHGGYFTFVKQ